MSRNICKFAPKPLFTLAESINFYLFGIYLELPTITLKKNSILIDSYCNRYLFHSIMDKKNKFNSLLEKSSDLLQTNPNLALQNICKQLFDNVLYYNWVGFYFMNPSKNLLEVGPYEGAKTDHIEIPFGRGICGQVAVSGETFVVEDVHKQSNYLSCSIETKAEIVVPIYRNEVLIGQIDIDSHYLDPFDEEDQTFLENLCALIAKYPESYLSHLHESLQRDLA